MTSRPAKDTPPAPINERGEPIEHVPPTGAQPDDQPTSRDLLRAMLLRVGFVDEVEAHLWCTGVLGIPVHSTDDLTEDEASELVDRLVDGEARRKAQPDNPDPTVHQAVARVMRDIGQIGVGKTNVNTDQHYNFRGIDDLVNKLSPILSKHGVVVVPHVDAIAIDRQPTRSGGSMMYAALTVRYTIYGPRGDYIEASTLGMGSDVSDKAPNKAMSAAFKYVLGQVFAVPMIGWVDGDQTTPEETVYRDDRAVQAARPVDTDAQREVLARISAFAGQVGVPLEQFTAAFRAKHGGISLEQMREAPTDLLRGFVTQVEAFLKAEAEKATEKAARDAEAQRDAGESAPQP